MTLTNNQLFFVAILGISGSCLVLIMGFYWLYRGLSQAKALEREERRLMIEKGMSPPPAQAAGWPAVKAREAELRYQERRLLIEKGMQPGAENGYNVLTELLSKTSEEVLPERYLSRGLKALAFGLGLAVGYVVFNTSGIDASDETRNWFLFFAVISAPIAFYGVANLVYYRAKRDQSRGAAGATVPGPDR